MLKGFDEFAIVPRTKRTTGLHEVWFRYDDEMEYIARARRSEILIRQYQANALAGQPIITSLLIDDGGLVQGYRIVNDPRVEGADPHQCVRPRGTLQGHGRGWAGMHRPAGRRRRAADRGLVRQSRTARRGPNGVMTRSRPAATTSQASTPSIRTTLVSTRRVRKLGAARGVSAARRGALGSQSGLASLHGRAADCGKAKGA